MSEAQQWKIIEHSWRNTSIENEKGRIICELDLESFDDLNEDNQNEYEQLQRADAELIASAPALRDECKRLRWALTFVVKTTSDPELSFGDRVSVIRHTAQAALTPAAGGTRR